MQAWLMDDYKGIAGLRLADAPDPVPQPDEVVLEVHYAGLNPADAYLAEKQYPAKPRLPHILGRDGVGTVVAVGSGVGDIRVGDRRAILRSEVGINQPGTFAQRVAVPARKPRGDSRRLDRARGRRRDAGLSDGLPGADHVGAAAAVSRGAGDGGVGRGGRRRGAACGGHGV